MDLKAQIADEEFDDLDDAFRHARAERDVLPLLSPAEAWASGDEYRVLRGASFATAPVVARTSFRNRDYPIRRQIFCGVRLAADA